MHATRCLCPILAACLASAADPSIPQVALSELASANAARADLARAHAEWEAERERLEALIAVVVQDATRLDEEATRLEAAQIIVQERLADLGDARDLDLVRADLDAAAKRIHAALNDLAARSLPGAVSVPAAGGERPFDEAMRALDASERSAASVVVEIVTGTLDGQQQAVRLLRIADAAAWWTSLDGSQAGVAKMTEAGLRLDPVEMQREAIRDAVQIVEGRQAASLVIMPLAGDTP